MTKPRRITPHETQLAWALRSLLGCAELNQDDIEDETRKTIAIATKCLDAFHTEFINRPWIASQIHNAP